MKKEIGIKYENIKNSDIINSIDWELEGGDKTVTYLSTEDYKKLEQLKKMLEEIDFLTKFINGGLELTKYCRTHDCDDKCMFNKMGLDYACFFAQRSIGEDISEEIKADTHSKLKQIIIDEIKKLDPEWKEKFTDYDFIAEERNK